LTNRTLSYTYGEAALSETTCRNWFPRFRSDDFDVEDKERAGRPELVEDAVLEALLDKDPCQMQEELAKSLEVAQSTIFMHIKH